MARWETGARERLQTAALDLFSSRGFDGTTVAEIAAAAGLTERTFFRHFADKREVLFSGREEFEHLFVASLEGTDDRSGAVSSTDGDRDAADTSAPSDPMGLIGAAIGAAAAFFPDERRTWSRLRQEVIDAHEALRERELLKLSSLASTLTDALVRRGVDPISAALAAESGVTVFRTAFAAWIAPGETRSFADLQTVVMQRLHALVGQG